MSAIKQGFISAASEFGGDLAAFAIEGAALAIPVVGETVGPVAAWAGRKNVKNRIKQSLTNRLG